MRRLLAISWGDSAPAVRHRSYTYLRYANAWTPVQAYYAVYMSIHADLGTAGIGDLIDELDVARGREVDCGRLVALRRWNDLDAWTKVFRTHDAEVAVAELTRVRGNPARDFLSNALLPDAPILRSDGLLYYGRHLNYAPGETALGHRSTSMLFDHLGELAGSYLDGVAAGATATGRGERLDNVLATAAHGNSWPARAFRAGVVTAFCLPFNVINPYVIVGGRIAVEFLQNLLSEPIVAMLIDGLRRLVNTWQRYWAAGEWAARATWIGTTTVCDLCQANLARATAHTQELLRFWYRHTQAMSGRPENLIVGYDRVLGTDPRTCEHVWLNPGRNPLILVPTWSDLERAAGRE